MTILSVENLINKCGAFTAMYILMKVPSGEAYQSKMFNNASIAS